MFIDYSANPVVFEGAIQFPDYSFGSIPAAGGGSPGVGGPVIERVIIRGSTAGTSSSAGGNIDDSEANPS